MSERKQTPDILAEILSGGAASAAEDLESARPAPAPPAKPKTARPAQPKRAATQPATKTASAWEHRLASFQEYKGWRLRYIDGKEVKDWFAAPLLHEYLDLLAGEGWQVAAACSGQAMFGHADKYQVFFKRSV